MMQTSKAAAALAVLLLACVPPHAWAVTAVDGLFDDWDDCADVWGDPTGDGGHAAHSVDFTELRARSDAERVTFLFDVGAEINLQDGNMLTLLIDADADTATGRAQEGLGVDLAWKFGFKDGRFFSRNDEWKVDQSDVGLLQAPTVSSSVFEVSFLRRSRSGHEVVLGPEIAFVLTDKDGDRLPDTGTAALTLSDQPPTVPPFESLDRADPAHIRVVTWNVLFDGLFKRPAPFIRVLRALDPDVVCFQEVWSHTARQSADYVSLAVPESPWYGANTDEGQIVSRYPIAAASPVDVAGNYWALVDLPDDRYPVDLSVVCAHPPCCDKEIERQRQLDGIAAWVRDLMAPGPAAYDGGPPEGLDVPWGTPVIIVGDMNLVGGADQVLSLTDGRIADEAAFGPSFSPDWDGTAFADSWARHAGGTSVATWRDATSAFAPGKLDYVVFSDSALKLERAFVLATEELSEDVLERYGLQADDTLEASDHLPVVADFTPIAPPSGTRAAE